MRAPKERFDFIQEFLSRVFGGDLHAKRILSLANGTLGVMTGAALAVSLIGQALATARGLIAKSAIKQVDRLLSNAGVAPWDSHGAFPVKRQFSVSSTFSFHLMAARSVVLVGRCQARSRRRRGLKGRLYCGRETSDAGLRQMMRFDFRT
jgi:hypothetical protein